MIAISSSFATPELTFESRLNLLESPGLQAVVTETNAALNGGYMGWPGSDRHHDLLANLVRLSKPAVYHHLPPNAEDASYEFSGRAYPHMSNSAVRKRGRLPSMARTGVEGASLPGSSLSTINYRMIEGEWRVVFSLLADKPNRSSLPFDTRMVDVDPLEPTNALFVQNYPTLGKPTLVNVLNRLAVGSIESARKLPTADSVAERAFRNDTATDAVRLCDTDLSLSDYRIGVESRNHYFALDGSRITRVLTHPNRTIPIGVFGGMKFLADLGDTRELKELTPEDTDAPSMLLLAENGQRYCYPLARLATLRLIGFQAAARI